MWAVDDESSELCSMAYANSTSRSMGTQACPTSEDTTTMSPIAQLHRPL